MIPIGKPIGTSKVYIVDGSNHLQPIGITGELCIGGDGLARGYLNRPALTAEKFVDNPFVTGEKMYRTGDLARWLPDGNIEYIGRIDDQVKIRGYRIELGEIESRLLEHEAIRETVVVAREDKMGEKYLCGYIVSERELTVAELRRWLATDLPEYMIPSYFVHLEGLPLTSNGKIDKRALPEPDASVGTGIEYVGPRNRLEEDLVKVWSRVLRRECIGILDNFFSLGGNSLLAIAIEVELKNIGIKVEEMVVFKHQTIEQLAIHVGALHHEIM